MKEFIMDGMVAPSILVTKEIQKVINEECPCDCSLYEFLLKKAGEGDKKCQALVKRIIVRDVGNTEETPKQKLKDIYSDLNIRRLSNYYFGKTAAWLYQKFDRIDVDKSGIPNDFTTEELRQLKDALYDFSERIRKAADKL